LLFLVNSRILRLSRINDGRFLLSFHLFTLVRKGTSMETNKTSEQTTSGVENIRASGPNWSVFRWFIFLPAALGSSPNRAPEGARQEKKEVDLPWDGCPSYGLMALYEQVYHGWQSVHVEIFSLIEYLSHHAPKGRGIHSRLRKDGAFCPD
jgi:hypothetical protein